MDHLTQGCERTLRTRYVPHHPLFVADWWSGPQRKVLSVAVPLFRLALKMMMDPREGRKAKKNAKKNAKPATALGRVSARRARTRSKYLTLGTVL